MKTINTSLFQITSSASVTGHQNLWCNVFGNSYSGMLDTPENRKKLIKELKSAIAILEDRPAKSRKKS